MIIFRFKLLTLIIILNPIYFKEFLVPPKDLNFLFIYLLINVKVHLFKIIQHSNYLLFLNFYCLFDSVKQFIFFEFQCLYIEPNYQPMNP